MKRLSFVLSFAALVVSSPAYASNATGDETLMWTQLGLGILGGAAGALGGAYGVYSLCDTGDGDDISTGCMVGMGVVAFGGMLLGTTTTVWGIGEASGYDGSWTSTMGGALVGGGFGIIGGPLALVTSSVGAGWFYRDSTVDDGPADMRVQPIAPTTTLLRLTF
jgi:hypothetical protein